MARARKHRVGNFCESLEKRLCLTAIASGQTINASIGAPTELDTYTFSANAGDSIRAAVAEATDTAFLPVIELFAPNGTRLAYQNGYVGADVTALSVAQSGV